ncbi:MAG: universal stress protein [Anaerolineae bacterium]|nr:universal stress protein [Thermoflexales bacterium]MDW8395489.1 universal stress protein [Anaerolineae bacterium]
MFKKILVPLDGSTFSEAVLPYVVELARAHQADVELFCVSVITLPLYPLESPIEFEALVREEERQIRGYLDEQAAKLSGQGVAVTTAVGRGSVPEAILNRASAIKADLIAMSTHGRSGISRWLMGSVADRVLHGAHVPVLLVRPEEMRH